jgi:N-acetylglucosaminyldiphosphoundecaprenol N-acetyl-beta-D-mannosaminyltransferase
MESRYILGMRVDQVTLENAAQQITQWSEKQESRYICVSNVHMCMEAYDNCTYQRVVNSADLVVPDGKPLIISSRLLGNTPIEQVRGADLTRKLLSISNMSRLTIGLYGGTPEALQKMVRTITMEYPKIKIGCVISPPFRELTRQEKEADIVKINNSAVQVLFVGLGCPKQEMWMSNHKGRVYSVMVGVGAVFDFLGGTKKEAPEWLQSIGLEWLHRLIYEPKRLWKRYAKHNPRFLWYFTKQLLQSV